MTIPFVGLRPFDVSESDVFFGRKRETQVLANLVLTLPILVVYAPSGTGKSSLINAGLQAALTTTAPDTIIVNATNRDALTEVRAAYEHRGWSPPPDMELADMLHQYWLDNDERTLVVIDQFEERLNAGTRHDDLYAAIAKLVHQSSDSACILISIREDYLGALEPLMRRVPSLLNGSYRVPPLSRDSLREAIYGPLRAAGALAADEELVELTLDELQGQEAGAHIPGEQRFEPGYFQIVWSALWDAATARGAGRITVADYNNLGGAGKILADFTEGILANLEPFQAHMFWAISRYLVLPTGAKTALTIDDLLELLRETDFLTVELPGHSTIPLSHPQPGRWIASLPTAERQRLIRSVFGSLTASRSPLFQRVVRGTREEYELLHDLLGSILLDWRRDFPDRQLLYFTESTAELRHSAHAIVRGLATEPDPSAERPEPPWYEPGDVLQFPMAETRSSAEPSNADAYVLRALDRLNALSAELAAADLSGGLSPGLAARLDDMVLESLVCEVLAQHSPLRRRSFGYELHHYESMTGPYPRYAVKRAEVVTQFFELGVTAPSATARARLQRAVIETTFYSDNSLRTPRDVKAYLWARALPLVIGGAFGAAAFAGAAELAARLFPQIDVAYRGLALWIGGALHTFAYAMIAIDDLTTRSKTNSIVRDRVIPALRTVFLVDEWRVVLRWITRKDKRLSGTAEPGQLPFTWPLPAVYHQVLVNLGALASYALIGNWTPGYHLASVLAPIIFVTLLAMANF
ncbi:hypothetical protein [Cryptosporangium aurantiacum]|uniref:Novel STAND NTPase 1 domain-containing protein n=1 Tax=Cryptosporangium aurantiacum TaxID=134849 RepID=A0A1M7RJB7_9ACTN|nr:hypothetical protein [Cryptosporangium aurantiacum]SHN46231.1 hypothetical protein SAMN05443668_11464 [Cryptosporangium aurantiacum]